MFGRGREVFSAFRVFLEASEIPKSYIFQGQEEGLLKHCLCSTAWRAVTSLRLLQKATAYLVFFSELVVKSCSHQLVGFHVFLLPTHASLTGCLCFNKILFSFVLRKGLNSTFKSTPKVGPLSPLFQLLGIRSLFDQICIIFILNLQTLYN